jgi:hypothetical protein
VPDVPLVVPACAGVDGTTGEAVAAGRFAAAAPVAGAVLEAAAEAVPPADAAAVVAAAVAAFAAGAAFAALAPPDRYAARPVTSASLSFTLPLCLIVPAAMPFSVVVRSLAERPANSVGS